MSKLINAIRGTLCAVFFFVLCIFAMGAEDFVTIILNYLG